MAPYARSNMPAQGRRERPLSQRAVPLPTLEADGRHIPGSRYHQVSISYDEYDHTTSYVGRNRAPFSDSALGIPSTKPLLASADVLALLISCAAFSLATASVYDTVLAWRLGVKYQLIVVGFSLSIMNLCLASISPTFFLYVEARYGQSTLQNYEGHTAESSSGFKVAWYWRLLLLLLLVKPLVFSATYKIFLGGQTTTAITPGSSEYNSRFGIFPPPGMGSLGWASGLIVFFNATTPFLNASTSSVLEADGGITYGPDPPMPNYPQPYGFNMLVIDNETTAMLDAPPTDWTLKAQQSMEVDDSWNITASVLGTVTYVNNSVDAYQVQYTEDGDPFWSYYHYYQHTLLHHRIPATTPTPRCPEAQPSYSPSTAAQHQEWPSSSQSAC
jgi:hypothetical protein